VHKFRLILSVFALFIFVSVNHTSVNAQDCSCVDPSRWGDVDMSGTVDAADAIRLQSMVISHLTLSEYYPLANLYRGYTDSDYLDNNDLVTLQLLLAGHISNTSLPISGGLPHPVPQFTRYGDLNGDGFVTVTDLLALSNALVGNVTLTADQRAAADVNYDGAVTATDLLVIANYLVGNVHVLPAIS